MRSKGKQVTLAAALDGVVRRLDRGTGGAYLQLKAKNAWSRVAGPAVLSHTTGAHLRGKELVVYVDSNAWGTELSALSGHYLQAIEAELGKGTVSSLRFTVSRKVKEEARLVRIEAEALAASEEEKVASIPLDDSELEQVRRSVESIGDEELREAVLRATIADLAWKKGLRASK